MKNFECDGCGDVWGTEFLCAKCSSEGELIEERVPQVMWDYFGDDTELVESYVYRAICGNCCPGH